MGLLKMTLSDSGRLRVSAVFLLPLLLLAGGCSARPEAKRHFPEGRGTLVVEMAGFRSDHGQAITSLFSAAKGFPEAMDDGILSRAAPVSGGRSRVVFAAVPWGEYALSVLHDENGDGLMQSNWLGIPKEGHGASNNPENRFGPPDFDTARFVFVAPERTVRIKIRYYEGRSPGSQRP